MMNWNHTRYLLAPLLFLLAFFVASCGMFQTRGGNARLTPEQMANLPGFYLAGGEQAGDGIWKSDTMLSAVSATAPAAESELLVAITFGEDVAPDAPTLDASAIEGKNSLETAARALAASKSPQAAAAAAALGEAAKLLTASTKPLPTGDRKGAQGFFRFKGMSEHVLQYGVSLNNAIAAIRARTVPRADAATTTTTTEKYQWTEGALGKVLEGAVAWMAYDLELAKLDEQEVVETPADPPTPPPVVHDDGQVVTPDGQGTQTLLWKPTSDSNGKLVVLLPAAFNNAIDGPVTVNGEAGTFSSVANGNRSHFRFGKPGSAYSAPAVIRWKSGGRDYSATVAKPAERTSIDGIKPATVTPPPVVDPPVPPPATSGRIDLRGVQVVGDTLQLPAGLSGSRAIYCKGYDSDSWPPVILARNVTTPATLALPPGWRGRATTARGQHLVWLDRLAQDGRMLEFWISPSSGGVLLGEVWGDKSTGGSYYAQRGHQIRMGSSSAGHRAYVVN